MAPTSRIILTRHAQAEHNVDLDYSNLAREVDLVASSPLKRTLQTTKLGWAPAVYRLGIENIILLPEFQECNDHPCDVGTANEVLEKDEELKGFNFSNLPPDWISKEGFWSADRSRTAERAKWVRHWLRDRPEKTIVLVGHGDILRELTVNQDGPSGYMWKNAEARLFTFDPETVEKDECFLWQEKGKEIAVAGGYAPTSTEEDVAANGKL